MLPVSLERGLRGREAYNCLASRTAQCKPVCRMPGEGPSLLAQEKRRESALCRKIPLQHPESQPDPGGHPYLLQVLHPVLILVVAHGEFGSRSSRRGCGKGRDSGRTGLGWAAERAWLTWAGAEREGIRARAPPALPSRASPAQPMPAPPTGRRCPLSPPAPALARATYHPLPLRPSCQRTAAPASLLWKSSPARCFHSCWRWWRQEG